MKVTNDVDLRSYLEDEDNFWSGAHDSIKQWKNKENVMNSLQSCIEEIFMNYETGEIEVDQTTLNDFIWFDAEDLLKDCYGFNENELWGD